MSPPASAAARDPPQSAKQDSVFHPSVWGDHFLSYASISSETDDNKKLLELKEEVKRVLMAKVSKPAQKLELIDAIQRLGVSYHFENEIDEIIENIHNGNLDTVLRDDDDDLYSTSLQFRLLRQHGYKISCDVFEKFKNEEGGFKTSLINDVKGMLSLYEAAHLSIRGEDILDEAITFTTTHLNSILNDVSPNLAEQINHALNRPLRKALPRFEALYYMSVYPKDDSHNETLLRMAKLDFNIVQAAQRKELYDITQWWKSLDFSTKLPYARDRLVELYVWVMGAYFEPQYAFARKITTKVICMLSIIDDTYDAYGTLEELKLFTEIVNRWDIDAIEMLPDYMKLIYKALLDVYGEIEEDMAKEGRSYCISYAKKEMEKIVESYFAEAKWFNEGYVPTMEEYMSVALISSGYSGLPIISFLGMGDIANKPAFDWASNNPKIVRAACLIGRLMDDIVSHKFEQERGHVASSVECYMKQHGVSEEEVVKLFRKEIANAWKDLNEEFLKPTAVPVPLLERVLNLSRVVDLLYKHDDCYTNCYKVKDQIASLLVHPLTL